MDNPVDPLDARKKEILAFLREDNVKTVVLYGEMGVGKTWTAREVTAILKDSTYATLWMTLGKKYEERVFLENIAFQLSVFPSNEEWEEDDKNAEMEQQDGNMDMEALKKRIMDKLKLVKPAKLEETEAAKSEGKKSGKPEQKAMAKDDKKDSRKEPYLLIVLDDIADEDQDKIFTALNVLLHGHLHKVLITRRGRDINAGSEGIEDGIQAESGKIELYKIKPLFNADPSDLLKKKVKEEVSRATGFGRLSDAIRTGSSCSPGVIIMIAEALNQVEDLKLDSAVEEAASVVESGNIPRLLQFVDDMLPSTLNKCCWHCRYLFPERSGIHYNELITHWLLEGYFDHHDHIENAYEEAHRTLMVLKDLGFLREQENSYVYMESDALTVTDHRRDGLSGSACVGMACVLKDQSRARLGRVIQTDGMIKTSSGKGNEMSTLLIDGARFCREVPETFFQRLKVLVIFNPMFKKLPSLLSKLKELQILVLRGCRLLESIDEIHGLTNLLVLEISGACLVKQIRDDLFDPMKDLRSLNLSQVGVKWLPASVLNRSELRWLILRKCPKLERLCDVESLRKKEAAKQEVLSLAKLEVLDFSGSVSFRTLQVKTLSSLPKLQILNLSKTKIERMPFFHNLGELTRLLLSDCQSLTKLPTLRPLHKLEILDLSRTKSLKEVQDDSLATKAQLRVLDLTGSAVIKLPSAANKLPHTQCSLSHLTLSGCRELPKLPSTQGLKGLEELNLSGASKLGEFEDESFEHLDSLHRLILSDTEIKALPSLSQQSELRSLLLKNCKILTELQNLTILQKLEDLDLSGCSKSVITSTDSFQGMSRLKKINLSETQIESLPQDGFPSSLRQLIIRNCPDLEVPSLKDLQNLEVLDLHGAKSLSDTNLEFLGRMSKLTNLDLSEIKFEELPSVSHLTDLRELSLSSCSCRVPKLDDLKKLELLDLSGTKVESLPILTTFSNLRQLLLRDCSDLEDLKDLKSLSKLEVLDLSGTKIKEYPYETLALTSLRKLNLQGMKHITGIDWKKIKYIPEEFNLVGCGSLSSESFANSDRPSISICGTRFLQFVEENPRLWDTCFQKFHFCVWLPKNQDGSIYDLGDRGLLIDIESQGRIPRHDKLEQHLEIHGSFCIFSLPESVLKLADHISLIDDGSFSHLSELVIENLKIKSCWLDRCMKIESIVNGEEDARASGKLEFLYLCNLSSLRCVCDDKVQAEVFEGLKSLYIECCPMLTDLFPLPKLPKELETLRIKFCDEMKELFKPGKSAECNLQTLDLMELPKLVRIGVMMVALQVLKVRRCPSLENLEEVLGEAENLEILHISYAARLKTIVKSGSFQKLKELKIESCPQLKEVSSSSEILPDLQILEINSCESLEAIFRGSSAGSSLSRLRLCSLPSLSSTIFKVPSQCDVVNKCPNLQIDRSG